MSGDQRGFEAQQTNLTNGLQHNKQSKQTGAATNLSFSVAPSKTPFATRARRTGLDLQSGMGPGRWRGACERVTDWPYTAYRPEEAVLVVQTLKWLTYRARP